MSTAKIIFIFGLLSPLMLQDYSTLREAKAIRFSTLEAICKVLDCQPGDILEYSKDD